MIADNQPPTVLVTISLIKRWLSCCENLKQYAVADDTLTIDVVKDKITGKEIKIKLDKL